MYFVIVYILISPYYLDIYFYRIVVTWILCYHKDTILILK